MANINITEYSAEKEVSTSPPNPASEYLSPEERQDRTLDQNIQNEDRVLDDSGIKSTSEHSEPLPRTPEDGTSYDAELPPEPAIEQPGPPGKDYSILTVSQKRMIAVAASFASLFSPMATAIYCECLLTAMS